MRTSPRGNIRVTPNIETSSGTNPGENYEGGGNPLQLDAEIPRGAGPSASPFGKPTPRSGIGLEAGQSAGGGLNVTVAVPIGGPISGRGGLNIGKDGEIKGGQIGLGIGGGPLGASIDIGTDEDETGRGGCYRYVTVSVGWFFSHTYGRNVCEPRPSPEDPGNLPPGYSPVVGNRVSLADFAGCKATETQTSGMQGGIQRVTAPTIIRGGVLTRSSYWETVTSISGELQPMSFGSSFRDGVSYRIGFQTKRNLEIATLLIQSFISLSETKYQLYIRRAELPSSARNEDLIRAVESAPWVLSDDNITKIEIFDCAQIRNPSSNPTPVTLPPPNPPPTIKMNDECCKLSLLLQAEILRLLGREIGPNGLPPQSKTPGFIGEEIERTETPIADPAKPKKIKIRFSTIYEMLLYGLKQEIDLDVALDPKSYKIPTGKLQNPAYSRDSAASLQSNTQPNRDKAGNNRELEINKDNGVKISGFLQQQDYLFQMVRRLEYLFPAGELNDALVAKSLLIPGAPGDIKIHNMIMAYEVLIQYLDAALGNPREILTVKDANPAIAGDQPIEVRALSISDLLRQNIKFHIDTGGDVDALVNLELRDFRTGMANRETLVKVAEMVQALFEDSGMLEKQEYIELHQEGDPYAGQWIKGEGFKPNPDLEKKTEEATEKTLRETMKPTNYKVKVSRRSKDEKTDMRDLLRGLADFIQRLFSVPTGGDAASAINKLVENAKFKVQTEAALLRQNYSQAQTSSRNRTRKRKK